MRLNIKTKLRAGLLFLFSMILLMGVLGGVFLYRISNESKMIIKDNYESIVYAKAIAEACDQIAISQEVPKALNSLEINLKMQQLNITEPGEAELTAKLTTAFDKLKKDTGLARINDLPAMRKTLHEIEDVNLVAIEEKNDKANQTAKNVILWMSIIGSIAILLSFSFVVNFPGYIANPIKELTEGIKEINNKNYSKRLHFSQVDEFGELSTAFNSMTEKLEEYDSSNLAKLLFEKKRLDTVINSMHDAIIGLDENKNILFLNTVATQLLGVKQGTLEGKPINEAQATNDLLRELTRDIETHHENSPKHPLKIFADGRESYFNKEVLRVTAIPTGETETKHIGYVIVVKNITHFRELDLAKTNFIATVSHELKTPISAIKMSLKLMEDQRIGKLNEEQEKLVDYIRDETNRLLNITGELLDLAQVETGKISLDIRPVDPREIVDYAVKSVTSQAQQKNIFIKIDFSDNMKKVNADVEKSAWVLINLLANAIRYAPEQSTVELKVISEKTNVRFTVRDFGKGLPGEYAKRVFEKYFRAPGGNGEGSGLGLAIAKEFIESQNGQIGVVADLEKGAVFWFTLPGN